MTTTTRPAGACAFDSNHKTVSATGACCFFALMLQSVERSSLETLPTGFLFAERFGALLMPSDRQSESSVESIILS